MAEIELKTTYPATTVPSFGTEARGRTTDKRRR